jgi:hypothetical protein
VGQQQLLLVVLGVIVVGLAVTIGIFVFRQNAIDQKRDLVMNECNNIANLAIKYYKKPTTYGGGGSTSFQGFNVPGSLAVTPSGTYTATVFEDSVIIIGTGNDVVSGNDSIKIMTIVNSRTHYSTVIN